MVNVAKVMSPICIDCSVKDTNPPGAPQVRVAAASAKLLGPDAQFIPNGNFAPAPATRDPAYFELGNWEPGTKIQILNKSNSPTATFANEGEIVTLDPTGRDIENRIASVWLTQADMDKINLDAGDSLWIRLIDSDGNASSVTKTRLQGAGYGTAGRVNDGGAWQAASRITLLDGEAQWKQNMVLRHIGDSKAPQVKAFEAKLALETAADGSVTLRGDNLLEEGARVRIQNGTDGLQFNGAATNEQALSMPLGVLKDGDTLFVTVSDVNGVAAGKFEIRYGASCKDGRAPTKGILGAMLGGVIKPG